MSPDAPHGEAPVRIAFLGTPDVAVPPLEALLVSPDVEVVVVVTNPDRPRGRSRTPQPPPVKVAAEQAGVPVWQPERPREVLDDLRALDLDAAAVVAYGALLPTDVLEAVRTGFVNLHYSLLPRWRGAAPVQHAIRAGDEVTGATTFVLDAGMDTGAVIDHVSTPIGEQETAGSLLDRLTAIGAPLLVDSVVALARGTAEPTPQPDDGATLAPKITPDDVAIDWTRPAVELARLVRSANPAPGAHTTFRGERCKLWHARPVEPGDAAGTPDAAPGEVVDAGGTLLVACGEGLLEVTELQPAGKPRMAGDAFANGYRPERFGA
ncbi:MAG: methionyl-tRNA formyltransferase [Actinomycetes bacterium]